VRNENDAATSHFLSLRSKPFEQVSSTVEDVVAVSWAREKVANGGIIAIGENARFGEILEQEVSRPKGV